MYVCDEVSSIYEECEAQCIAAAAIIIASVLAMFILFSNYLIKNIFFSKYT